MPQRSSGQRSRVPRPFAPLGFGLCRPYYVVSFLFMVERWQLPFQASQCTAEQEKRERTKGYVKNSVFFKKNFLEASSSNGHLHLITQNRATRSSPLWRKSGEDESFITRLTTAPRENRNFHQRREAGYWVDNQQCLPEEGCLTSWSVSSKTFSKENFKKKLLLWRTFILGWRHSTHLLLFFGIWQIKKWTRKSTVESQLFWYNGKMF